MKTNTTQAEIETIKAALEKMHARTFACRSCDPKTDAQNNLSGKTHYVDDGTLRFHHSKVLSVEYLFDGLLLRIVTSDSLDMNNTSRGFRAVVFDVFGTVLDRPELADASKTSKAALKVSDDKAVDLVAHYQSVMEAQIESKLREMQEIKRAVALFNLSRFSPYPSAGSSGLR